MKAVPQCLILDEQVDGFQFSHLLLFLVLEEILF